MKCSTLLYILFISLLFISCDGLKQTADKLLDRSPRAVYAREFKSGDSLFVRWDQDFQQSFNSAKSVKEPFSTKKKLQDAENSATAYKVALKRGDRLLVRVKSDSAGRFFISAHDAENPLANAEINQRELIYDAAKTGDFTVVVQPELRYRGEYTMQIFTQPSLAFPVAGKGNRDAQSFWGADRDGGARKHEGVDIFAKRGTPVIAAANGVVSRTGNQGLGGKQVWLNIPERGISLYYAHLDSIMVSGGKAVKTGDTLGTVGNTGNAEGGTPHLHFGVYGMGGAADAWPFIRIRPEMK